jgi:hypothetical protein
VPRTAGLVLAPVDAAQYERACAREKIAHVEGVAGVCRRDCRCCSGGTSRRARGGSVDRRPGCGRLHQPAQRSRVARPARCRKARRLLVRRTAATVDDVGRQIAVFEGRPHRSSPRDRLEQDPVAHVRLEYRAEPDSCQQVTLSGLWQQARGTEVWETMTASTPMGRLGEPEEIAAAVAYLASDDASSSSPAQSCTSTAATSPDEGRAAADRRGSGCGCTWPSEASLRRVRWRHSACVIDLDDGDRELEPLVHLAQKAVFLP